MQNRHTSFLRERRCAFHFSDFPTTHAQEESQLQGSELTATIRIVWLRDGKLFHFRIYTRRKLHRCKVFHCGMITSSWPCQNQKLLAYLMFQCRAIAEGRKHLCNDFIQIARIPGLTARTAFAAPSATSINGSYCFALEVGWQSSVILFMMALTWLSGSLTMFIVRCIAICWCEYPCRWHLLPILVSIPCGWGSIRQPLCLVKQLQMSNTRKYWLLTPFIQVVSASRAHA